MTTNYNKFKNTQIYDTNSLGYALSINGNIKLTNDNASTIYCNQMQDYSGNKYLKSLDTNNLTVDDEMSNNIATGNVGCGNLNSSNNITCVDLISNTLRCKNIYVNEITNHYKNKIAGYLNIGIAPYYKIPLTTSLYNLDDGDIINFYLSPLLINSNNNTLFLLPYYIVTFYNNENIIFYSDNSSGLYPMLFQNIIFDPSFTCTKILISYKNIII